MTSKAIDTLASPVQKKPYTAQPKLDPIDTVYGNALGTSLYQA